MNPPAEPKEIREPIKVAPVPVKKERPAPNPVNPVIDIKKKSVAESVIKAMKPKMPSILDPKTPQQIKVISEFSSLIYFFGI